MRQSSGVRRQASGVRRQASGFRCQASAVRRRSVPIGAVVAPTDRPHGVIEPGALPDWGLIALGVSIEGSLPRGRKAGVSS
jgi:hypothetical protein